MPTYGEAGVDLGAASRHVRAISDVVTATWNDTVVGSFGGFAAGVEISSDYECPVLMMSTDGVGTKLELARRAGRWAGVGHDLVAMCVDDLAAAGATPVGFVDYMAVGALDADRDETIVSSIAEACAIAGCPLLGGETAEHPGVMEPEAVDLAGAAMGVIEKGEELGPHRAAAGNLVVGLASPNLRSNGFSLVRMVLGDEVGAHADVLLSPSVIYSPSVGEAVKTGAVVAAAHITGGGIAGNLSRVIPAGMRAEVDTSAWERPAIFGLISSRGVGRDEMYQTFNMGIGFCLVVDRAGVDRVMEAVGEHDPRIIGELVPGTGVVLR